MSSPPIEVLEELTTGEIHLFLNEVGNDHVEEFGKNGYQLDEWALEVLITQCAGHLDHVEVTFDEG